MTSKTQQTAIRLALAATLGLAGLSAIPAQAVQATATATGTIVAPLAITAAVNLVFGSFATGPAGTVTVSASGNRVVTGVTAMTGATPSAARFDIVGFPNAAYSITHSGSTVLSNGVQTMAFSKFSNLTGANDTSGTANSGTLSGTGLQSLYVGGVLTVAANQAVGVYTGDITATIEYN